MKCPHCDEYRKDYSIAVDGLLEARKEVAALQSAIAQKDAALRETIDTLNLVDPGVYTDTIANIEAALEAK